MESRQLQLRSVDKTFRSRSGTVQALRGIDLDLAEGEFVSIVGASGCGKSTLLRIVAGLEEATSGELSVGGAPLLGPGRDRGMVFQQYTLYPWQTAQRNIEVVLRQPPPPPAWLQRLDRAPRAARAVLHAVLDPVIPLLTWISWLPHLRAAHRWSAEMSLRYLEVVGLRDFAKAYPNQLSGGMQQRVAIARALALRPRILLMDEPFGALDAQTRSLMQELLLSIWERDRLAVLFVTHDIDEAIFLADRILVMSAKPGRVRELIRVPLERPRRYEQQMTPEFLELRSHVRGLIHDEAVQNTGFAEVLH